MGAPVSGGSMQVMHIDSINNQAVTTAGPTEFAKPGGVAAMFSANVDCWISQEGSGASPTSTTGFFLAAGVVLPLQFGPEKFYARADSTNGRGSLAALS